MFCVCSQVKPSTRPWLLRHTLHRKLDCTAPRRLATRILKGRRSRRPSSRDRRPARPESAKRRALTASPSEISARSVPTFDVQREACEEGVVVQHCFRTGFHIFVEAVNVNLFRIHTKALTTTSADISMCCSLVASYFTRMCFLGACASGSNSSLPAEQRKTSLSKICNNPLFSLLTLLDQQMRSENLISSLSPSSCDLICFQLNCPCTCLPARCR